MIPLRIRGTNTLLLGNPSRLTIFARKVRGAFETLWELTPEEIEMVAKGGRVRLRVAGSSHPAIELEIIPIQEGD
jgi:hypothetical protein